MINIDHVAEVCHQALITMADQATPETRMRASWVNLAPGEKAEKRAMVQSILDNPSMPPHGLLPGYHSAPGDVKLQVQVVYGIVTAYLRADQEAPAGAETAVLDRQEGAAAPQEGAPA